MDEHQSEKNQDLYATSYLSNHPHEPCEPSVDHSKSNHGFQLTNQPLQGGGNPVECTSCNIKQSLIEDLPFAQSKCGHTVCIFCSFQNECRLCQIPAGEPDRAPRDGKPDRRKAGTPKLLEVVRAIRMPHVWSQMQHFLPSRRAERPECGDDGMVVDVENVQNTSRLDDWESDPTGQRRAPLLIQCLVCSNEMGANMIQRHMMRSHPNEFRLVKEVAYRLAHGKQETSSRAPRSHSQSEGTKGMDPNSSSAPNTAFRTKIIEEVAYWLAHGHPKPFDGVTQSNTQFEELNTPGLTSGSSANPTASWSVQSPTSPPSDLLRRTTLLESMREPGRSTSDYVLLLDDSGLNSTLEISKPEGGEVAEKGGDQMAVSAKSLSKSTDHDSSNPNTDSDMAGQRFGSNATQERREEMQMIDEEGRVRYPFVDDDGATSISSDLSIGEETDFSYEPYNGKASHKHSTYTSLDRACIVNWAVQVTNCTNSSGHQSAPNNCSANSTRPDASGQNPRKRRRSMYEDRGDGGNKGDGGNESDDEPGNTVGNLPADKSEESPKRYACPFHKHNPLMFCIRNTAKGNYRACQGPGWKSFKDVKNHIFRRHSAPIYCECCYEEFALEADKIQHLRQRPSCEPQPRRDFEAVTLEHRERIKKELRKYNNDTEKWVEMYKILFPNDAETSPYYDNDLTSLVAEATLYWIDEALRSGQRAIQPQSSSFLNTHDEPTQEESIQRLSWLEVGLQHTLTHLREARTFLINFAPSGQSIAVQPTTMTANQAQQAQQALGNPRISLQRDASTHGGYGNQPSPNDRGHVQGVQTLSSQTQIQRPMRYDSRSNSTADSRTRNTSSYHHTSVSTRSPISDLQPSGVRASQEVVNPQLLETNQDQNTQFSQTAMAQRVAKSNSQEWSEDYVTDFS